MGSLKPLEKTPSSLQTVPVSSWGTLTAPLPVIGNVKEPGQIPVSPHLGWGLTTGVGLSLVPARCTGCLCLSGKVLYSPNLQGRKEKSR